MGDRFKQRMVSGGGYMKELPWNRCDTQPIKHGSRSIGTFLFPKSRNLGRLARANRSRLPSHQNGCVSKKRYQNGTLVSGNMDQSLHNPSCFILSHTQIVLRAALRRFRPNLS